MAWKVKTNCKDVNMKRLISILNITLLITSTASQDEEIECENCIKVEKTCYNLTFLTDLPAPFRNKVVIPKMGILRSKNTLFYSFEPNISDEEYYKVAYLNLTNMDQTGIVTLETKHNFGAFDIDQANEIIYLGGSNGIFSLDYKGTSPYSSLTDTIVDVFYKGNVYFITLEENEIVQKKGDEFERILPKTEASVSAKKFVINNNYVTVYLSTYGLFLNRNKEEFQISKNPFFRGLTLDLEGNVYAWWIDGIYKVVIEKKLSKSKVVKVAHFPNIGAMTFDGQNNIVFNSNKQLYKLIPIPNTVC